MRHGWGWVLAAGVLVSAAPAQGAKAATEPQRLAVLPVHVGTDPGPELASAAALITASLGLNLEKTQAFVVLSPDEVDALLQNMGERQSLGCDDAACLAELAGVLGARLVVSGEVTHVANTWAFSAALTDSYTTTTLQRATARASTVQGLSAQMEDVALRLAGMEDQAELRGHRTRRRLGLDSLSDLKAFRSYREDRPDLSVQETFTGFIVDRNSESTLLAAAEAAAFVGAAGVTGVMMVTGFTAWMVFVSLGQWVPLLGLSGVILALVPVALGLGSLGLVLAVLDAFNFRRVKVKAQGCCRQDADINDAEQDDGVRKALALATVMVGPTVAAALGMGYLVFGTATTLLWLSGLGRPITQFYTSADYGAVEESVANNCFFAAFACSVPLACMPLLCGSPVGMLLLAWPTPSMVSAADVEATATEEVKP